MRILISYRYDRGGACVKEKKGNLSAQMSRHHIISYPWMYFLGVLSLVFLKRSEEDGESIESRIKLLERAARIENKSIYNALHMLKMDRGGIWLFPPEGDSIKDTLYHIAWMPMNLFTGPSAKLRMDDPGQKNDKIPLSMPKDRKNKIENMKSGLRKYAGNINIPHAGGGTDCVRFNDERNFDQLMSIFFRNIEEKNECYDSKISDWFVGINENQGASRSKKKYYACKNNDVRIGNRDDRNILSAKFGVIDEEAKRVLEREKKFQIVSIGSMEVKGFVNKTGACCNTELNREIRSFFS